VISRLDLILSLSNLSSGPIISPPLYIAQVLSETSPAVLADSPQCGCLASDTTSDRGEANYEIEVGETSRVVDSVATLCIYLRVHRQDLSPTPTGSVSSFDIG
jgi:hypothetical protein